MLNSNTRRGATCGSCNLSIPPRQVCDTCVGLTQIGERFKKQSRCKGELVVISARQVDSPSSNVFVSRHLAKVVAKRATMWLRLDEPELEMRNVQVIRFQG